jgi:hypothetical protein
VEKLLAVLLALEIKSELTYVVSKFLSYRKHSQIVRFEWAKYGAEIRALFRDKSDNDNNNNGYEESFYENKLLISYQLTPLYLCRVCANKRPTANCIGYKDSRGIVLSTHQ